jgi:hypothetical protein
MSASGEEETEQPKHPEALDGVEPGDGSQRQRRPHHHRPDQVDSSRRKNEQTQPQKGEKSLREHADTR